MSNSRPLIIAILITLIIQGINFMVPYPEMTTGDNTEQTNATQNVSKISGALTGTSENEKSAENILKSLNAQGYLDSLPFEVTSEEKKDILSHFNNISRYMLKNEKEKVKGEILQIESILKPYWFKDGIKEKFMSFEVFKDFLIYSDYKDLKSKEKEIFDMDTSKTTSYLFNQMSSFVSDYYKSMNNILSLYKSEITENKVIEAELSKSTVIKKNKLVSKPSFDYETFLYSRAFEISSEDMNNLYTVYEDYKNTGKKDYIKKIHKVLKPYWLKQSIVDTIIPKKSYESTVYTFLSEDERKKLNSIYDKIVSYKDKKEVENMLDEMIKYNQTIGDLVSKKYKTIVSEYDLNDLILKKGE